MMKETLINSGYMRKEWSGQVQSFRMHKNVKFITWPEPNYQESYIEYYKYKDIPVCYNIFENSVLTGEVSFRSWKITDVSVKNYETDMRWDAVINVAFGY